MIVQIKYQKVHLSLSAMLTLFNRLVATLNHANSGCPMKRKKKWKDQHSLTPETVTQWRNYLFFISAFQHWITVSYQTGYLEKQVPLKGRHNFFDGKHMEEPHLTRAKNLEEIMNLLGYCKVKLSDSSVILHGTKPLENKAPKQ